MSDTSATATLPPVDELPPVDDAQMLIGSLADYDKKQWPSNLIYLPSEWFMVDSDVDLVAGERKLLADQAKRGDAKSVAKVERFKQVVLEMMSRTREDRLKEDPSGRPLYIGLDGKETTGNSVRLVEENNRLVVFKRATERRSVFAIRKGREAQGGPGTPYIGEAFWKREVEEHFLDLLPQLEFKSLKPEFAPKDYPTESAMAYAKNMHAEKVANPNSAERQRLMRWLTPFLKNPVSKWDGEN